MTALLPRALMDYLARHPQVYVAGGAALAAVTNWGVDLGRHELNMLLTHDAHDVDLFLVDADGALGERGASDVIAGAAAVLLGDACADDFGASPCSISFRARTLVVQRHRGRSDFTPYWFMLRLQMIPLLHDSVHHLLESFDVDACKVAFHPATRAFHLSPQALLAIDSARLRVDRVKIGQEQDLAARLFKYLKKGFDVDIGDMLELPTTVCWARDPARLSGAELLELTIRCSEDKAFRAQYFRMHEALMRLNPGCADATRRVLYNLRNCDNETKYYGDCLDGDDRLGQSLARCLQVLQASAVASGEAHMQYLRELFQDVGAADDRVLHQAVRAWADNGMLTRRRFPVPDQPVQQAFAPMAHLSATLQPCQLDTVLGHVGRFPVCRLHYLLAAAHNSADLQSAAESVSEPALRMSVMLYMAALNYPVQLEGALLGAAQRLHLVSDRS